MKLFCPVVKGCYHTFYKFRFSAFDGKCVLKECQSVSKHQIGDFGCWFLGIHRLLVPNARGRPTYSHLGAANKDSSFSFRILAQHEVDDFESKV